MEKKKYFFSLFLMFVVGALDAYCYMLHDGMFASMQTGNMIKIAIKLAIGDYNGILPYVTTIISFAIGIIISRIVTGRVSQKISTPALIGFSFTTYLVGILIPLGKLNPLANMIMALGVGAQLHAIRSIYDFPVATTMCTGNLRSLSECIGNIVLEKDKERMWLGVLIYSTLITSFCIGVFLGGVAIKQFIL